MALSIVFTPSAQKDLLVAKSFYATVTPNLGEYCKNSLLADISRLAFTAGVHSKVHGYYRALARNFPFSIYLKIIKRQILIVAVLDNQRHPSYTSHRLNQE